MLLLLFIYVKTLIMLMLLLEQSRRGATWLLRATWCPTHVGDPCNLKHQLDVQEMQYKSSFWA